MASRSDVASSFTIIKGSLIEETYAAFRQWDLESDTTTNLRLLKDNNSIGASSSNWLRDVAKVIHRRFDPDGRDKILVHLAQGGCPRDVFTPILLWHMTRDEFLVRDFLVSWIFSQFKEGAYRLRADDVVPYLKRLPKMKVTSTAKWSDQTLSRVASGLLRMAVDFGLMTGTLTREFASYHLPEAGFLYLLHAMHDRERNAMKVVRSDDWKMYLMAAEDVERELFRLHQFRRVEYHVAGSLAQLKLPCASAAEYAAKELVQ